MNKYRLFFLILIIINLLLMKYSPIGRLLSEPLLVATLLVYYINEVKKQHSLVLLSITLLIVQSITDQYDSSFLYQISIFSLSLGYIMVSTYLRQFKERKYSPTQIAFFIISLLITVMWGGYLVSNGEIRWLEIIKVGIIGILSFFAIRFPKLEKLISKIGLGATLILIHHALYYIIKINDYDGLEILIPIELINYCGMFLLFEGIIEDAVDYFSRVDKLNLTQAKETNKRQKK